MNNMNGYVVRTAGAVDIEATVNKFRGELATHIATLEASEASIADAVSAVFDTNLGTRMPLPALRQLTLTKLGTGPADYAATVEAFDSYVHANATKDGIFSISKGKNGGVARVSDIPAPAATPAQ